MASQDFTSGDLRIIADFIRAVASGTFATSEIQEMLNRSKLSPEKTPVWFKSGVGRREICEKPPADKPWETAAYLPTSIEEIHNLHGEVGICCENEVWGREIYRRLKARFPRISRIYVPFKVD